MSTRKCAPCPARSTFGDHANAQCFDISTWRTPAAAAVRSIEPTLPGSCTSSISRQKSAGADGAGVSAGTTAIDADPRRQCGELGKQGRGHDQRAFGKTLGQRRGAGARERVVGDDQRFRGAVPLRKGLDEMLAFEHAFPGLAPIPRRGDETRGFLQPRIVA